MPVIMLSEEQAKLINETLEPIEFRDPQGRVLGKFINGALEPIEFRDPQGRVLAKIHPVDLAAIERARRASASGSKSYPSKVVQAHMRALQDAADKGMSQEQLWELHQQLKREAQS
jgi:hypothetical protein